MARVVVATAEDDEVPEELRIFEVANRIPRRSAPRFECEDDEDCKNRLGPSAYCRNYCRRRG